MQYSLFRSIGFFCSEPICKFNKMKYKKLGLNGPKISTVGFGAWGISGRDWGITDDKKSRKAIHAALDSGVNFIDTADVYGFS